MVSSRRRGAKRLTHLAKFWNDFPWGQGNEWVVQIERDSVLRHVQAEQMEKEAQRVKEELDDQAVLLLFSVFEANIRDLVETQVQPEIAQLQHPALKNAADELLQLIQEGSFGRLMARLKEPPSNDLIEQVNQIRRYRNWVAHGRREDMKPDNLVQPEQARDRLKAFLALLRGSGPITSTEPAQRRRDPSHQNNSKGKSTGSGLPIARVKVLVWRVATHHWHFWWN